MRSSTSSTVKLSFFEAGVLESECVARLAGKLWTIILAATKKTNLKCFEPTVKILKILRAPNTFRDAQNRTAPFRPHHRVVIIKVAARPVGRFIMISALHVGA